MHAGRSQFWSPAHMQHLKIVKAATKMGQHAEGHQAPRDLAAVKFSKAGSSADLLTSTPVDQVIHLGRHPEFLLFDVFV